MNYVYFLVFLSYRYVRVYDKPISHGNMSVRVPERQIGISVIADSETILHYRFERRCVNFRTATAAKFIVSLIRIETIIIKYE